jgi:glycosyltransferase involved in cell wall biosynthesis
MKFWEAAEQNGMTHHDYWNTGDVDFWLSHARVLVDPSWSKNYSKNGGHFNRVVVDAMIRGCVPVARPLGMGDELFKAGEHYIAIPQDVLVEEYADIVLEAGNMSPVAAQRYRDANRAILPMFDRATVAGRLIGLVNGEIETEATQGTMSKALYEKTDDILFDHFGVFI